MSTEATTKINQLLQSQPAGIVLQSNWLTSQGYSLDLQKRYKKSNWFESIGTGAIIRTGDQVGYEGGIYALQKQSGSSVHPAGRTALSFLGKTHYLELSSNKAVVFGDKNESLPRWFLKRKWDTKIDYYQSSFLPMDVGLTEVELKNFSIKVSGAERAMMECLYLAPKKQELMECLEIMEGLNNMRPNVVQTLLEKCQSVKVKRLFLYMAEKCGHEWFQYLDTSKVDLGKGKRSMVINGIYIPKYMITVPKAVAEYDR